MIVFRLSFIFYFLFFIFLFFIFYFLLFIFYFLFQVEVHQFQLQKQRNLNEISIVVPLRLSQLYTFDGSGAFTSPPDLPGSVCVCVCVCCQWLSTSSYFISQQNAFLFSITPLHPHHWRPYITSWNYRSWRSMWDRYCGFNNSGIKWHVIDPRSLPSSRC